VRHVRVIATFALAFLQQLGEAGFVMLEELTNPLAQTLGLTRQRFAGQDTAHAGVFLGKLQGHAQDALHTLQRIAFLRGHLLGANERVLLDVINQPFQDLALAGKMSVQRSLGDTHSDGKLGGGNPFPGLLLQHLGKRLKNLFSAVVSISFHIAVRCLDSEIRVSDPVSLLLLYCSRYDFYSYSPAATSLSVRFQRLLGAKAHFFLQQTSSKPAAKPGAGRLPGK